MNTFVKIVQFPLVSAYILVSFIYGAVTLPLDVIATVSK